MTRPEAETFLPTLGTPTEFPTKSQSWRVTTVLRVILLAFCPIVISAFINRTAQRHIIVWPCIILFITFAINLSQFLFNSIGKIQNDRKVLRVPVGVTVDMLCSVAVTIAMYIATWKRPRADRAESLIALVMGFIVGAIPLIIAVATYFEVECFISFRKGAQLSQETSEDDDISESSHIKYAPNIKTMV